MRCYRGPIYQARKNRTLGSIRNALDCCESGTLMPALPLAAPVSKVVVVELSATSSNRYSITVALQMELSTHSRSPTSSPGTKASSANGRRRRGFITIELHRVEHT